MTNNPYQSPAEVERVDSNPIALVPALLGLFLFATGWASAATSLFGIAMKVTQLGDADGLAWWAMLFAGMYFGAVLLRLLIIGVAKDAN